MAKQFFNTVGAKLHYEIQGEGFPVTLIHAGIVSMGMWDEQMEALAEKYRPIRYDIRGWGESLEENSDYSDHDDLHDLMRYLEVDQTVLIGASYGGAVAMDMALAHPEMVKAIVLVGSGLSGYEFTNQGYEEDLEELRAAYLIDDKSLAADISARIWVHGQGRTAESVPATVHAKALKMIKHTLELPDEGGNRIELEPPAISRLDEIKQPVLIIVGENDQPDIFEISQLIRDSIPQAEAVIIDGAAHLVNMEKPKEVNRLILDFLDHLFAS